MQIIEESSMAPVSQEYMNYAVAKWLADGRDHCGSLLQHSANCGCDGCKPPPPVVISPLGLLYGPEYEAAAIRFANGEWWGLFGEELMALEKKVADERTKNHDAIEATSNAHIASFEARNKADRVAVRVGAACTKRKTAIAKVAQPCKFLYNCQGTPARPTTLHVSTECWSHEYVDPVTGAKVCKHVCDRMHPGEEGWLKQWDTDRNHKAPVAAVRTWASDTPRHRF